jgi:hypothetical protein
MQRYGLHLAGLLALVLVSGLFLSACVIVPVDERDRHGDELRYHVVQER